MTKNSVKTYLHSFQDELIYYPKKNGKECGFCGISSFAHKHKAGSLPKDFERKLQDDVSSSNALQDFEYMVTELFWMARRYAHGRHTFSPGTVRDIYHMLKTKYPHIIIEHDVTIEPPTGNMEGMSFRDDYLDDTNL